MVTLKPTCVALIAVLLGFTFVSPAFAYDDQGTLEELRVSSNSASQALLVWLDGTVCGGNANNSRLALSAQTHEALRSAALAALLSGRTVELKTDWDGSYCHLLAVKFID